MESTDRFPVVIFTGSDVITAAVRETLLPRFPIAFAESEDSLHRTVARGTRLVVLHLDQRPRTSSLPGRLVRAVPQLTAPVIALGEREENSDRVESPTSFLADVLCVRTERWMPLLAMWAGQPNRGRERAEALRLLHAAAPAAALPMIDTLALLPVRSLSVKGWSAALGTNRTRLFRSVVAAGLKPSEVLDAVRIVFRLGPYLLLRPNTKRHARSSVTGRTDKRLLARTLGLHHRALESAGEPGSDAVRDLIALRLQGHFSVLRRAPSRQTSVAPKFGTVNCDCAPEPGSRCD
jgi:hypothetical protein